MLRDLFVEEFMFLEKGWEVTVKNTKYFVVAEASLQLMDAKAMEEQHEVKFINSYAPCFRCRKIKGVNPAILRKITLNNHRRFCDEMHFTRGVVY